MDTPLCRGIWCQAFLSDGLALVRQSCRRCPRAREGCFDEDTSPGFRPPKHPSRARDSSSFARAKAVSGMPCPAEQHPDAACPALSRTSMTLMVEELVLMRLGSQDLQ